MATAVARFPFVSKTDILRAYRPGAVASERTFRTLRQRGWVSAGVAIRHRRKGRVVGQLRCYSALNLDAVVLARHDKLSDALDVAAEAERFENDWTPVIAALAKDLDFEDFESFRALRNQVAHQLAPASSEFERLHTWASALVGSSVREEFVRIGSITAQWAALEVLTKQFSSFAATSDVLGKAFAPAIRQLAVDSFLPAASALRVGDLAVLRIEHSAGSSLLSMLAAMGDADELFELGDEFSAYFSDEPLPPSVLESVESRRAAGQTVIVPPLTVPLAS